MRGPIWAYTYFFRGTPMLIQLFLIYYGLAQFKEIRGSFLWPILREGYWCCLIAFTLNTAAYTIEIIAGAIRNVPHTDVEAALAMGMSRFTAMRRIVLPVALRILFPAYTNEVIFVLQSTSLASLVTVLDLTGIARVIQRPVTGGTYEIPGEKLIWFCYGKEGDDFRGRPMLRPMYKPWKLKQELEVELAVLIRKLGGTV